MTDRPATPPPNRRAGPVAQRHVVPVAAHGMSAIAAQFSIGRPEEKGGGEEE